ncbi:MAG: thioesterase family protein [Marinovum sp.]|nr:thioesterase family protein [Marinovum sp.]
MTSRYSTTVIPEWIDYNGHMQDCYYALIFSRAVDGFQDDIGVDATYRQTTGRTIYLLENHLFYLREVKVGAEVHVETQLIGHDSKRFHLYMTMFENGDLVSVCEVIELHVNQHPQPHAEPMPDAVLECLRTRLITDSEIDAWCEIVLSL